MCIMKFLLTYMNPFFFLVFIPMIFFDFLGFSMGQLYPPRNVSGT